jgi:cytosine/adenosine deaminase-related metal-dependent hydrolase
MFWKGPLFTKKGFVDTCIDLETCKFVENDKEEDGIIVPLFRNCHTHLGDTDARKSLPNNLSLAELVGPGGWKHKWLEENNIERSILEGLKEATYSGTGLIMDFREGGKKGLDVFEIHDYLGTSILFGRPSKDGELPGNHAGISSLADVGDLASKMSSQAREREGLIGIHHSENEHEGIDNLIELNPDFVVHLCHATEEDLEALKDSNISVVVCPRSNDYFGNKPPLEKMIALGLDLGFGTDNGMICSVSMLDEIKFVKENYPSIDLHKILEIACFGLDDMFNKDGTSRYFNPKLSGWALLSREAEDNYESIFSPETKVLGARWRN